MNIVEIIEKKKRGEELSLEEISFAIEGVLSGSVKDYQMSALLMAICLKGMTPEETTSLTMVMRDSGDILDLSSIGKTVVDKHSTGGVGDKTTLIVGPIMASLGIPVAKMSGRGLGITGGTIDKLDSIPGFSSDVADAAFIRQVKEVGIVDAAQNLNLAPADKVLYALHRDVVGTIFGRAAIGSGVNAEDVEVALVARPGPVVGVGPELADAPRRAAHEAHVLVFVVLEEDVLVAAVERHDLDAHVAVAFAFLGD